MATIAILLITLISVFALFRYGETEERAMAVIVLVLLVAVRLVEPIRIDTWRAGVAALDLAFLLAAVAFALLRDRWWLTALAGFQAIAVLTHVVPLVAQHRHFSWTGVTIRLEVWLLICLTFFAGAWEAWAARRFNRESRNNSQHDTRSGLVDLERGPNF